MKTKIFTSVILLSGFFFTKANAQCMANWQPNINGCTVNFTNLSQGNSSQNWIWNFGDNQTGNTQNPSHTFSNPGTYLVCLNFNSPSCSASYCTSVTVNCSATGIGAIDNADLSLYVQNPISQSAEVNYSIPVNGNVEVGLYDMLGNKISVQESGNRSAGIHSFELNTNNFSKGIYLLSLNFEGIVLTKKIVIAE